MFEFEATLDIIGVNPFVWLPEAVLTGIFEQAGKSRGNIPVCGEVNGVPYRQTLVRYAGAWRLYINTSMLKNSPKRIGETLQISISCDQEDRRVPMPEAFRAALEAHPHAQETFNELSPSRQLEIVRYLASLKREASLHKNVERAIGFLEGKERFVGRDARP